MVFAGTGSKWAAATGRANMRYSHTYNAPATATFAAGLPQRVMSTSHNMYNARTRTRGRRENIADTPLYGPRTVSDATSIVQSGTYRNTRAFKNPSATSGYTSGYHEGALCATNLTNLALKLTQYLSSNNYQKAMEQSHDCMLLRDSASIAAMRKSGIMDPGHEYVINLMQNLYTVFQQYGSETNGASVTFDKSAFGFILQKNGDTIQVDGNGIYQAGGKRTSKKTRKQSRKNRKTRKQKRPAK